MNYQIEWRGNNCVITYSGMLSLDDITKSVSKTVADPRFDTSKYQIGDFLNVKGIDFGIKEIQIISAMEKAAGHWNKKLKVASIATDPLLIELIVEYNRHMLFSNWQTQLFNNMEEALQWCNE